MQKSGTDRLDTGRAQVVTRPGQSHSRQRVGKVANAVDPHAVVPTFCGRNRSAYLGVWLFERLRPRIFNKE